MADGEHPLLADEGLVNAGHCFGSFTPPPTAVLSDDDALGLRENCFTVIYRL